MDSYLEIAERVLKEVRKPLSARQILRHAERQALIPDHLFGRTQHKTLQARIAEDILARRNRSPFMRTEPGRFILRALRTDPTVPEAFRREFPAPSRSEQLRSFFVLTVVARNPSCEVLRREEALSELTSLHFAYHRLADVWNSPGVQFVRILTVVCKNNSVVMQRRAFRTHSEREPSDKKSIGLLGFVKESDRTLFSHDPFGFVEAATRTLSDHLAMSISPESENSSVASFHFCGMIQAPDVSGENSIAVVMSYRCSPSQDPVRRLGRASGFEWSDNPTCINDLNDFDPWSKQLLRAGLLSEMLLDEKTAPETNPKGRRANT